MPRTFNILVRLERDKPGDLVLATALVAGHTKRRAWRWAPTGREAARLAILALCEAHLRPWSGRPS